MTKWFSSQIQYDMAKLVCKSYCTLFDMTFAIYNNLYIIIRRTFT